MNQSVIAGIGNIYRTEILWRQFIHPNAIGSTLSQMQLESLWTDAQMLLKIGMRCNKIITTLEAGSDKTGERLNVYGKRICPRCDRAISQIHISGRKAFVCETCQGKL